jgi:cysteine desulfurase family protein
MAVDAGKTVEETRSLLAELFDASSSERVAFTLNCTDALNMAIKGVLRPGDHAITSLLEHNSIMRPLKRMEHEAKIELSQLPLSSDGYIDPSDIRQLLKPNTRLLALTHASNVLGTVQPIAEVGKICHEHDVLLLVDAAQTAGILPISLKRMHIDLLALPGHKALFGPPGTGALILGDRAEPKAFREGGTGVNSEHPVQPTELPVRLEAGTPNTLGIAGFKAGLKFIRQESLEAIASHEQKLTKHFINGLQGIKGIRVLGPAVHRERVATVSLSLAAHTPAQLSATLDREYNIAIRPGLHCAPYVHRHLGTIPGGTARFSFGYFNTIDEIDYCINALQRIAIGHFDL